MLLGCQGRGGCQVVVEPRFGRVSHFVVFSACFLVIVVVVVVVTEASTEEGEFRVRMPGLRW